MTDAVISKLSTIKAFHRVIPFASTVRYKDTKKSIPEIARELGVQKILQGNFQLSGNELKIKFYLIDGTSNTQLWSEEYSGIWKTNEIFKIQSEVTENVAKIMNIAMSDFELKSIQKIPNVNQEAYDIFLQAEFQSLKFNKKGIENAVRLYEKALDVDPDFVQALSKDIGMFYVSLF